MLINVRLLENDEISVWIADTYTRLGLCLITQSNVPEVKKEIAQGLLISSPLPLFGIGGESI